MKIYRYRSISTNTYREIINEKHWFSRFHKLNDPFEGLYVNKTSQREIDQLLDTLRVCCFSKSKDCLLMWAHYANSHKGICLEIEVDDDIYRQTFMEVNYELKQPILNSIERTQTGHLSVNINNEGKIFLTKSTDWDYEKEIRTFRIEENIVVDGGMYEIQKSKITGIYFGVRVDKLTVSDLNKILSDNTEIKFYQANLGDGAYELSFTQLCRNEI